MRRLFALLSVFALSLGFSMAPSNVFVIHAGNGSLKPNSGMHKEKQFTLVFSDVSNMISLGSTSEESGDPIAMRDFLSEWKKNSSALSKTPAHGALRASHEGHPFSSNVNIVSLTYTANKNELTMVVSFLNYMAKQPAMKPAFALDHPMLVISENALPEEMVKALSLKKNKSAPSQGQSHGDIVK